MGLLLQHYDPTLSAKQLFDAHVAYGERYPEVPRPRLQLGRKIRLGYVSGAYATTSVAHFLLPLIENHDRTKFDIFLYSRTPVTDEVTDCFRLLGKWRELGDDEQKNLSAVRDDGINILIDCDGFTKNHSLWLFALRPAPISVTFLGYPDTTGLRQIDYRLTDEISDPAGSLAVERLIRLPNGIHTYRPFVDVEPPPPRTGPIVFGNLGNPRKLNTQMRDIWKRILKVVPDSSLIMKFNHNLSLDEYFETQGKLDIALDTVPYNGTTTVCDALWMGTPVVTLLGDRCCARTAASLLTRVGLTDLIARDADDYVRIAVELAKDREMLSTLRTTLRDRLLSSPLGSHEIVVKDIERFYVDAIAQEAARP